jgi:hypothetical protein
MKKQGLTQEEVRRFYIEHGYATRHNTAHLYKDSVNRALKAAVYRIVISRCAVRKEVKQVIYNPWGYEIRWNRLRSGYLKNLSITPDGKLAGLTRKGC